MQSAEMQKRLLRWFARHARDLPWRRTRDPYRIWVSEIMLQQTQVATVIPYYQRWLRRFPSVQSLARAKIDAVLKQWEGLGYYRRARNLHRAACEVVRRHGGRVPADRAAMLALPGIGRYTAGAILSIAFGQPEPLVDGNVARVLARLFGIRQNVKSGRGQKRLWQLAGELIRLGEATWLNVERASKPVRQRDHERTWKSVLRHRAHPGLFNQALMELGATICMPQSPRCDACPVRAHCGALRCGAVATLPNVGKRPASRLVRQRALLIWRDGRVLIRRRPADGLLGGFWEFPSDKPDGVSFRQGPRIATVRHSVMNERMVVEAFDCHWLAGGSPWQGRGGQWRWARPADLRRLALIGAHRKIVGRALHLGSGRRGCNRKGCLAVGRLG
jgi:A/G-specific adenine glycosylase